MKLTISLMLILISGVVSAHRIQSKINSIDEGDGISPHIIKMENGNNVFLDGQEKTELPFFQESMERGDILEIEVDRTNSLVSVQTLVNPDVLEDIIPDRPEISYDPSIISESTASTVFQRMRRDYQNESQCYNRAHIWAYEEFNRSGLRSMKLFLFFTNRYIRNYRYHWWFHVSPMALVSENGFSVERVLDRRYTSGPHYIKNWTDIFIYSRRTCPKVYRYNDYRNNQESEDCYLIPVSMYFWQPRDILYRDQTGPVKTQFYRSEVNWARNEAF